QLGLELVQLRAEIQLLRNYCLAKVGGRGGLVLFPFVAHRCHVEPSKQCRKYQASQPRPSQRTGEQTTEPPQPGLPQGNAPRGLGCVAFYSLTRERSPNIHSPGDIFLQIAGCARHGKMATFPARTSAEIRPPNRALPAIPRSRQPLAGFRSVPPPSPAVRQGMPGRASASALPFCTLAASGP